MKKFILIAVSAIKTIILTCVLTTGCIRTQEPYEAPVFPRSAEAEFTVLTDELMVNMAYDLWCYKDYLIVTALTGDGFLHIYDKETGDLLMDAVGRGRGPGEVLSGRDTYLDIETGIMVWNDMLQDKVLELQIDALLANGRSAISERTLDIDRTWLTNLFLYDGGGLAIRNLGDAATDTAGVVRLQSFDPVTGEVFAQDNSFPVEDRTARSALYMEGRYALSPDKTRLAAGTFFGCILETCAIGKDRIRRTATRYFIRPEFDFNSGIPLCTDKTVCGFYDLYATDDRIYASYDGKTNPDVVRRTQLESRPVEFCNVAVFDWKGNPETIIRTDYNIERLCVDSTSGNIYAVIYDVEGHFFLGRIKIR